MKLLDEKWPGWNPVVQQADIAVTGRLECPACNGERVTLTIDDEDGKFDICAECGGTGHQYASVETRLNAADKVKKCLYPELKAVEFTGEDGGPMKFEGVTDAELLGRIEQLTKDLGREIAAKPDGTGPEET